MYPIISIVQVWKTSNCQITPFVNICFVHSPIRASGSRSCVRVSINLYGPFYGSTAPSKDKRRREGEPLDKTLSESPHSQKTELRG